MLTKCYTVFSLLNARGIYLNLDLVDSAFPRTRRHLLNTFFSHPFFITSTGRFLNKEPNFNKIVQKCETTSPTLSHRSEAG